MPPFITAAVEGITDEAVAGKLISHVGAEMTAVYGKQGKAYLLQRLAGYNHAAQYAPWFMLVDLDRDADCAPLVLRSWLPSPAAKACFRVAVRAVEAWLIADAEALADFLAIPLNRVPDQPEALDDPKKTTVDLARSSRCKAIRDDMVLRDGSGRAVGPAYSSRMVEFVRDCWRPHVAAKRANSLNRAIRALSQMMETLE